MTEEEGKVVFPIAEIKSRIVKIFERLQLSKMDAETTAEVLLKTELCGVASHGIIRVPRYAKCLVSDGIKAQAKAKLVMQNHALARFDAKGGLGIPASVKAGKYAIKLAKKYGIAMVNVFNSHHNGAEGYYAYMIAQHKMAGMVMSTGNPIMAVTGTGEKNIGNNPFAYGAPAGKYDAVILDIAMSAVADGKVQLALAKEESLPENSILDADGNASVNPQDYFDGGTLLPFGGHKGYGLALMVEIFAGILSGAASLHEINSWNEDPGKTGGTGHVFIAVDIGRMMPFEQYTEHMEKMLDKIKSSRPLRPDSRIYLPGEIEIARKNQYGDCIHLSKIALCALKDGEQIAGLIN